MSTHVKLDDREHATVLAALHYWQQRGDHLDISGILDIVTNGGEFESLDNTEINDLCERINTTQSNDLYMRYLGVLKLLKESSPHVDDDIKDMIKTAFEDACARHPLRTYMLFDRVVIEVVVETGIE